MYDVAKNLHEVLDKLPMQRDNEFLERVMSRNLPRRWQTCPKT